jgi:inosine/xanthosine triphosphatase
MVPRLPDRPSEGGAAPSAYRGIVRVLVGSSNPCKVRAVQQAFVNCLESHECAIDVRVDGTALGPTTAVSPAPLLLLDVISVSVSSGVSAQPMNDETTRIGAQNRARAAFEMYSNHEKSDSLCVFGVGIEGGLEYLTESASSSETERIKNLYCMAWICIYGPGRSTLQRLVSSWRTPTHPIQKELQEESCQVSFAKTSTFRLPPAVAQLIVNQGLELGAADDAVFGRQNSKHGIGTVGLVTNHLITREQYYTQAIILELVPLLLRPDVY